MAKNKNFVEISNSDIAKIIENEIGDAVWDLLQIHILTDVYGKYSPTQPNNIMSKNTGFHRGFFKKYTSQQIFDGEWLTVFGMYDRRYGGGLASDEVEDRYIKCEYNGTKKGAGKFTLYVTTLAEPDGPIFSEWDSTEPGGFLHMLDYGDLGFLTKGRFIPVAMRKKMVGDRFPRPVINPAQQDAESHVDLYTDIITRSIYKLLK